jgi:hypothetical protein
MEADSAISGERTSLDYLRVTAVVLGVAFVLVANGYMHGAVMEAFRLPKESAFRAEALVLLVIAVFAATAPGASWRVTLRAISTREWLLAAAIVAWTVVTTLTSTNRALSWQSVITVLAAVTIWLATRVVAPRLSLIALDVVLAAACGNAIMVILQELRIWNPFTFPSNVQGHGQSVGLLGNANDVGVFLLGPTLAAIVAAVMVRGWRRLLYFAFAALLFGGIVASQTRTAMLALLVGVIVTALLRPWRQGVVVAAVLIVAAVIALRPSTPFGRHFLELVDAARTRNYPVLFSERVVPFLSAIEMAREHPITGVGPGCYKYQFMDTRLGLDQRYPAKWTRGWPMSFAETHNDHLQVAAETGLVGYALLAISLLMIALPRRRRSVLPVAQRSPRAAFGHALRAPLAATFFVGALAQFPLQLAAPRLMFLTLAALAVSWDTTDE